MKINRPGQEENKTRHLLSILFLVLGLVLVLVLATAIGSVSISPTKVIQAVWHGISNNLSGTYDTIIWRIRLPRALLAGLVGSSLAISGVAYQGVFRNPLADPYLLGVASGASFGAAVAIVIGINNVLIANLGVAAISFIFSLISVFLVIVFARQGNKIPITNLILAGAVLGSSFSAATSFLMISSKAQTNSILSWILGSFSLASWSKVFSIFPFFIIALLLLLLSARALNLLQLGEEQAMQLGLAVTRFKYALIIVATLATSAAVSVSGIIGFVGLMVPHAARLALGPNHKGLIISSALMGAIFLILADLLARTIIAPEEIPIGVITALVGGPFFLFLLRRARA